MEQPSILFILVAFIVVLGPLVFFHELGHYGMARVFGVKCDVFSIGFGREILGWTDKRGMRWKVGWLPMGGYVRFAGDADAASRPNPSAVNPADPALFANKPVWQRFLVVLAGPVANFILAIAIFAAFFASVGMMQPPENVVGSVQQESGAAAAGLEEGDRILSVAGKTTDDFDAITRTVILRPGETVPLVLERDGSRRTVAVTIGEVQQEDVYGETHRIGRLGIGQTLGERRTLWPLEAIGEGVTRTIAMLDWIVDGLGRILFGNLSVKEIGGPIKMAQVTGQQAQLGWEAAVGFAALLSINLGFINLLPVPMLDGGHLLFYAIEAIRRKPVSDRAQEWAFRGGMALIAMLVLFTTLNDLSSIGVGERIGRLMG